MSIRSTISVKIPTEMIGKVYENIHGHQVCLEGEYMVIYCHFDGYLDGVGEILQCYYNSFEKAFELILGGDISSIAESPEGCDYYVRRGESWENNKPAFSDKPPKRVEEYLYIFESGKWYVYNGYNCNGPLEDYLSPEISSKDDMISLPKNFCYYLHGYLSGLSSTQREDKGLDSIIKTLEGYLDV